MSDITSIGGGNTPISGIYNRRTESTAPAGNVDRDHDGDSDTVELSPTAQLLAKLAALPDQRQDLINSVKSRIASGTYETDDKLNKAIDALAQDLG